MCGINVIVDKTKTRFGPEAIQAMNAAIRHRGPDGEPHYEKIELEWATVWLGATRLALRGGAAGQQPTHSLNGRITLVYNGEIYNIGWQEGSDTSALAAFLMEYPSGHDAAQLNGMYAFAYVDHRDQRLNLGRDPFGIKPLFAWQGTLFSSEIEGLAAGMNALEQALTFPLPKAGRVYNWLEKRHPGLHYSLWNDIQPVTGAHIKELAKPNIQFDKFYTPFHTWPNRKPTDLKPLMLEVLERQLVSDRPVGLMLSGGYDSAFLLACLAEMGGKLPCYTLAGTPDAEPAARMAAKLGFEHRLVPMPTDWRDLETYMRGKLHPIADSGGFATWLVARQARRDGVPVLLSGAGADELLGGYRRHRALYTLQSLFTNWFRALLPEKRIFEWMMRWNGLGHLAMERYALAEIKSRSLDTYSHFDPRFLELADYLRSDVLMVTDQATMAHGVEARVPYLDNDILAELLGIPWMKLMAAGYKAPLVPALKEAGIFDLLLKKKTGFGLWDTALFEGLPILQRLLDQSHILYQYLKYEPTQKALKTGTPHARFSVCQLAYSLEFIVNLRVDRYGR